MSENVVIRIISRYCSDLLRQVTERIPQQDIAEIKLNNVSNGYLDPVALNSSQIISLQEADVILADTDILKDVVYELPKLRWLQSTTAGVEVFAESVDKAKGALPYIVTRYGGFSGSMLAEYVVGSIIARERHFFQISEDGKKHLWNRKDHISYRYLSDLSIGILGMGSVGLEIAKYSKNMGMTVWAMGRRKQREPSPFIDQYRSIENLPEVLASCDYICNVLPSTPETRGLLNADVLRYCADKKSVLINTGRGDIIDQASLVKAIREGWIGGATLDTLPTEPLPAESPLWDLPGVFITPHVSAFNHDKKVAEAFLKNYHHFIEGRKMEYEITCSYWGKYSRNVATCVSESH